MRIALLCAVASAASPALAQLGASRGATRIDPCPALLDSDATPFTEEAAARGISYTIGTPGSPAASFMWGGGSFIDLDLDGDDDIVIVGALNGRVAIYENDGTGHFTDRPVPGLTVPYGAGAYAADYDGDTDLDLFISCYRANDLLLRNDGGFAFTNVTAAAGVGGNGGVGGGSAFGDANGDGWPDLYVANRTGTIVPGQGTSTVQNRLFINQGDGTFVDMYAAMGLDTGEEPTLVGCFIDFDLDGDADIYEGNDKGTFCSQTRNELYENVGGAFVKITDASGTASCTDTMSIGIGDYDLNGWPDMYCTQVEIAPGNTLLMNNGDGTFTESAAAFGVASIALSWGSTFFDHDNDGDLALYVCNVTVPDRLYDYQGAWPAVDLASTMGTHAAGASHNVAQSDIDGDGDIDLLIELIPGEFKLFINHEGQKRNWISFKVWGTAPDHHALGALVRVRSGAAWQSSQVLAGGNSYRTQNSLDQHFGLGSACAANEIEVRWPDGQTRTLTDYPAGERYDIHPPGALGDGDGDGAITLADLVGLVGAIGRVSGESAVFDLDGNGWVTLSDLRLTLERVGSRVARAAR